MNGVPRVNIEWVQELTRFLHVLCVRIHLSANGKQLEKTVDRSEVHVPGDDECLQVLLGRLLKMEAYLGEVLGVFYACAREAVLFFRLLQLF